MITDRKTLHYYISQDLLAWGGMKQPFFIGQKGLKLQIKLRKLEYLKNTGHVWLYKVSNLFFRKECEQNGIEIYCNCFGPGLYIAHCEGVIVHPNARIGKNCKIQQGVTIGQTNNNQNVATIGDNVFLGAGAKIIGGVTIADDVAVGANAVVVKSITEKGTTWGGIPAKKISNHDSHNQLSRLLVL